MTRAIENPITRLVASGRLAIGLGVRLFRDAEIAGIAAEAGYDWLFIDLEHGSIALERVSHITALAGLMGCAPVVRVPKLDFATASRVLDGGALGVIFPHVATVEDARAIVDQLRYPPRGSRSFAARQAGVGFAARPAAQVMAELDRQILIFVMIESARGVENAAAIAAVPGIDVLFVGANDLAIDMGIPDQFDSPQCRQAIEAVAAAAKAHGKIAGIGGLRAGEQVAALIERGVSVILGDMEASLLVNAGCAQTAQFNSLLGDVARDGTPA